MGLALDPKAQSAIDLAKRTVPENAEIDAGLLLAALYHTGGLHNRFPDFKGALNKPKPFRDKPLESVEVVKPLRRVLGRLAAQNGPVSAEDLFLAVAGSESGREFLKKQGLSEKQLAVLKDKDSALSSPALKWRESPKRREAIEGLSSFGRMLTDQEPPYRGVVGTEKTLESLVRTLSRMRRRNAILIGQPGTGKSAVVYELARLLFHGADSIGKTKIPERLQDMDIFELSPSFLRSGASIVGQYDKRVKELLSVLQVHPKIILFVDEIHSLFQSSMHEKGPFSEANESFKGPLGRGDITFLGCTTPSEYRHYIEPDAALARRFNILRLEPPSSKAALNILKARRPNMEEYYAPLRIPDPILEKVIELSEEYLPTRFQPDKSITLLDDACAFCAVLSSPPKEISEDALWSALEDIIGHSIVRSETIREDKLLDQLREKIVGQDDVLRQIARSFVAGLGGWGKRTAPRGAYFFCGPTGVGKTETAVVLSKILGGGGEALIRVNCNTLQGSGRDSGPAINVLLGPPPGYIGYVRGKGGVLSKVRDIPESILLFDEIEKADPGIGKVLLQILDDGRVDDNDANLIDFRRSFIIFTTNAGCVYEEGRRIGFGESQSTEQVSPHADVEMVKDEMRRLGFGEEFLGRIGAFFVFHGLDPQASRTILERHLDRLHDMAELRGYELKWDADVIDYLASRWQPRFGVRHLITILRNRIVEQLSVADTQGELRGITTIRLRVLDRTELAEADLTGFASREQINGTLVINLA